MNYYEIDERLKNFMYDFNTSLPIYTGESISFYCLDRKNEEVHFEISNRYNIRTQLQSTRINETNLVKQYESILARISGIFKIPVIPTKSATFGLRS